MKLISIIQARMGSTRLPGKVLKPLGDTDVLSYVVARCRKIEGVAEVIVATSSLPQDDAIAEWCKDHFISYYRGSEKDVLDRYVQCAKYYKPDYVMRVTSDCPFVDYEMASEMVALAKSTQVEIIDIKKELPRGLAVEIISYDALCRIHNISTEIRHREHVTYYAYEFKEEFKRASYEPPANRQYPQLRITLDTVEDYILCNALANHFNNKFISSAAIVAFLNSTPEVAKINAHIEQKEVK
ncbi:3-deoxy-manno-octulosonate cytidylyltransferase [Solibacillus isronensis B3W22]|uniref:3-deoxy-manno-octulosonate cytidylyltransferase n=1 Tax=Solibacillus isronensis B3W22 TaxID=1224748 RepID=K1KWV0_9BACL|nr:glycosyltransferase family protein [Solibacillus isronensis]AMO84410.1 acylneuraminate cytidylyltransferase [Solibacillus silvestris]EKB44347.1 3-deoxy-manno-octulosonate cytidylyltransferase [Solibacillus isronensis B3W22]